MQSQTFHATHMDEALRQVRDAMGPEAVILRWRHCAGVVEVEAQPRLEPGAELVAEGLQAQLEQRGLPGALARQLMQQMMQAGAHSAQLSENQPALAAALDQTLSFGSQPMTGTPRRIAFVGPTGVGKTTTLAKLAAHAAFYGGREVALVSLDHHRVGGIEQVQRYAELMGVRWAVAKDAASLEAALQELGDADDIFIDTEGRSPRDEVALQQLAQSLSGAGTALEVHLCLTAATEGPLLHVALRRYASLQPNSLVITKLDEALHYGSTVAAATIAELPLAYVTLGQRVPEDIQVATPDGLASLLLQEAYH